METQITVLEMGTRVEVTFCDQICAREYKIIGVRVVRDEYDTSYKYTIRDLATGEIKAATPYCDEIREITDEGPECHNCERVLDECRCGDMADFLD